MNQQAFTQGFQQRWAQLEKQAGDPLPNPSAGLPPMAARKRLPSRYPAWVEHSQDALAQAEYEDKGGASSRYVRPGNRPPEMSLLRVDPEWVHTEGMARPGYGRLGPEGASFWMGPDEKWSHGEFAADQRLLKSPRGRWMRNMAEPGMRPSDFTPIGGPSPTMPGRRRE